MRILLTGATGFIGSRLTSLLIERGHELFCLLRPGTPCAVGATPLPCDLARYTAIETFPSVDTVIHLAQSHQYRNFPAAA
jgi:UDP-glucose 4-epimerase